MKDICTWSLLATRIVLQVLTKVVTMTRASEMIMHERVATDTGDAFADQYSVAM